MLSLLGSGGPGRFMSGPLPFRLDPGQLLLNQCSLWLALIERFDLDDHLVHDRAVSQPARCCSRGTRKLLLVTEERNTAVVVICSCNLTYSHYSDGLPVLGLHDIRHGLQLASQP